MKHKNQLRKHLPNSLITILVRLFHKMRGVKLGAGPIIYLSAKLSRYPRNISIGDEVIVKGGTHLCSCNNNALISIGSRSTIGFNTFIFSSENIHIGEDCMIAPFCYIVDSNHSSKLGMPMNLQVNVSSPIYVDDDVWLGANVTILPGVKINKGAIVAAGSVVNSNIGENEIYAGSPARKIGDRS